MEFHIHPLPSLERLATQNVIFNEIYERSGFGLSTSLETFNGIKSRTDKHESAALMHEKGSLFVPHFISQFGERINYARRNEKAT